MKSKYFIRLKTSAIKKNFTYTCITSQHGILSRGLDYRVAANRPTAAKMLVVVKNEIIMNLRSEPSTSKAETRHNKPHAELRKVRPSMRHNELHNMRHNEIQKVRHNKRQNVRHNESPGKCHNEQCSVVFRNRKVAYYRKGGSRKLSLKEV